MLLCCLAKCATYPCFFPQTVSWLRSVQVHTSAKGEAQHQQSRVDRVADCAGSSRSCPHCFSTFPASVSRRHRVFFIFREWAICTPKTSSTKTSTARMCFWRAARLSFPTTASSASTSSATAASASTVCWPLLRRSFHPEIQFSLSSRISGDKRLFAPVQWLCYLAPEVLRNLRPVNQLNEDLPFTKQSDVYAFGLVPGRKNPFMPFSNV